MIKKKKKSLYSGFSGHNGIKPEINNRKITGKASNTWKLNNTLLSGQWVKDKVSGKLKNTVK